MKTTKRKTIKINREVTRRNTKKSNRTQIGLIGPVSTDNKLSIDGTIKDYMAFDIIGPQTHLADDSIDYCLLEFAFHLPESLPLLAGLLERFYDDTIFYGRQVMSLKQELLIVKERYTEEIAPRIIKERKIHSRDPAIFSGILNQMLQKDRLYAFITAFIAVCDECLLQKSELRCEGD